MCDERLKAETATMGRLPKAPIALLSALGAAACAGDRISHVSYDSYSRADLAYAASRGPVPVRVLGAPAAGIEPTALTDRVIEAMTGANFGTPVAYTPYAGTTASGYVMALRFGARGDARALCADTPPPGGIGPDYLAAFCKDGRALPYLEGAVGETNIQSARFHNAIAGAASQLLPIRNPERDDCRGRRCD